MRCRSLLLKVKTGKPFTFAAMYSARQPADSSQRPVNMRASQRRSRLTQSLIATT